MAEQSAPDSQLVLIEDWLVTTQAGCEHIAPEARPRCLWGRVFGHPTMPDGSIITTSDLVSCEGPIVVCASRSYRLGQPHHKYLAWLEKQGEVFDPARPIPPSF